MLACVCASCTCSTPSMAPQLDAEGLDKVTPDGMEAVRVLMAHRHAAVSDK